VSVRRVIGTTGRLLVLTGVLLLLFVAYQIWGTGFAEARSQDRLRGEFEREIGTIPDIADFPLSQPRSSATSTTTDLAPPPPEGEAVAVLRIPKIGLDKTVVEGVGVPDLKKGPGHYPGTSMPGQAGNAGIAGHRTTYGAPFYEINELGPGDEIYVTTKQGSFLYEVTEQLIVSPDTIEVLHDKGDNRLTLTSCHPRYSAKERMIVVAELQGDPAPDDINQQLQPRSDEPDEAPDELPSEGDLPTEEVAAGAGLSGAGAGNGPALLWGVLALLVLVGEWAAARWWKKWPAYFLITPVFLVVLFVFFEYVSVLLPANV
jgi:sortase A